MMVCTHRKILLINILVVKRLGNENSDLFERPVWITLRIEIFPILMECIRKNNDIT